MKIQPDDAAHAPVLRGIILLFIYNLGRGIAPRPHQGSASMDSCGGLPSTRSLFSNYTLSATGFWVKACSVLVVERPFYIQAQF